MAAADGGEILFVVDVTAFTEEGFVGTTSYGGKEVSIDFDPKGDGVFLTAEMAERIGVKKGDPLSIIIEDDAHVLAKSVSSGVGRKIRISDEKTYYTVGREGGAVLRVRRS